MIEGSREYNEGLIKRLHKASIRVLAAVETTQGIVTHGNLSCNLSRKFVASLQHKLYETLPSVTCRQMNMSRNDLQSPLH